MGSDLRDVLSGDFGDKLGGSAGKVDFEPTGAYESFTGDPQAQPIDYAANPAGSAIADAFPERSEALELGRMGGRAMAGWGLGVGVGAAAPSMGFGTGSATGATAPSGAEFTGGLTTGPGSAATMGTGTGSTLPSSGLSYAGSEQVLGQPGAVAQPGLQVGPQAMNTFNAGSNLPFAAGSGINAGGEGMAFNAPASASTGSTAPPGGLRIGPQAGEQMGIPSTPATTQTPSMPPAQTPAAPAPTTPQAPGSGSGGFVDSLLKQMRDNALGLGLMGAALTAAGRSQPMPSQQQLQGLSDQARATADQLLQQYRSGTLSAGQAAQLEQLTQQTRNQITQYFSSIGQADSTSHMQALAQVDAQALAMKQQMLDGMLQQGLSALGIAAGPLNTIAQYQLGQDQALRQAFGNFATAVGTMAGRNSGAPQALQPPQQSASPTPATQSPVSSLVSPEGAPKSMELG